MDQIQLLTKCREQQIQIVVIGASAGGVDALAKILPAFQAPSNLSVMVVIHLIPEGPNLIPSLFKDRCSFKIKEAISGERICRDTIYVAPPNYHLSLEKTHYLSLSNEPPKSYSRPSIDVLFESAAHAYKSKAIGILLTGANHDGASGLELIKHMGGLTIIQDPKNAECSIMPEAGLSRIQPDLMADLSEIHTFLKDLTLLEKHYGN